MPHTRVNVDSWADFTPVEPSPETVAAEAEGFAALAGVVEHDEPEADDEPDREVVRAWGKANGYAPAATGQLKKVLVEAYAEAHRA